jgi:hypothetical protein
MYSGKNAESAYFDKYGLTFLEIADFAETRSLCKLCTLSYICTEVTDFVCVRAYGNDFSAEFTEKLYVFK